MRWLFCVVLVACGGSDHSVSPDGGDSHGSGSGSGSNGALAIDDYAAAYAKAYCLTGTRCCAIAEGGGSAAEPECESEIAASQMDSVAAIKQSIASGRVAYDPQAARQCIDEITAISCPQFYPSLFSQKHDTAGPLGACYGIFVGTVATGAACAASYECTGFQLCETTGAHAGTCVAVSESGATCESTCLNDLYCDAGTCHPHVENGQPCTEDFQCASGSCDGEMCLAAAPHCDGNGT